MLQHSHNSRDAACAGFIELQLCMAGCFVHAGSSSCLFKQEGLVHSLGAQALAAAGICCPPAQAAAGVSITRCDGWQIGEITPTLA